MERVTYFLKKEEKDSRPRLSAISLSYDILSSRASPLNWRGNSHLTEEIATPACELVRNDMLT